MEQKNQDRKLGKFLLAFAFTNVMTLAARKYM